MAGTDADPVALIGAQAAPAPAAAPAQPVAQVAAKVKPVQVKDDGLSILSDPGIGATVVDIVFVHGLQGHPKKTWSYSPTSKDFEDADYLAWYKELKGIPANQPVEAKPAETLQVEPPKKRRFVKSLSRLFSSKGKDKVEGVKDAGAKLQESIYWPAEILAKHIPNARVMTFGYDTHVIGASARNQGTIFSHSRNLLKSLKTTRGNKPDRALILVSHSLGGILVKETLRRSQVDPGEEMQAIFNATIGVIFFGTPHRGSPGWASFGKGVSGVASLILGVEANSEIIRALLPSGKELELGRESFAKQWVERGKSKDLPAFVVRTYQEGTGVTSISRGGLNKKIVPDESSSLDFPGQEAYMINADHIGMCKFKSDDDAAYQVVEGDIKSMVRGVVSRLEQKQAVLTKKEQECLTSLAFPEMDLREKDIDDPTEDTYNWLLAHEKYDPWVQQRNSLLWITGKPGAGKSTLIKYALQKDTRPETDGGYIAVSFFIHGRGKAIQKNRLGLFRSLLHQILKQIPELLSKFSTLYQQRCDTEGEVETRWNWHAEDILEFLETWLPQLSKPYTIRFYIDALDECSDPTENRPSGHDAASSVWLDFERLLKCVRNSTTSLSFCASCRHYTALSLDENREICVENQNEQDILKYVTAELQGTDFDAGDAETLQNKLVERSQGVFLWIVLVTAEVVRLRKRRTNINVILKKLDPDQTPPDLEALLLRILDDLDKEDLPQTLRLLQWVCFAVRPLSLAEVRSALIIDANTTKTTIKDCEKSVAYVGNDDDMEIRIKFLSGGLAEVKVQNDRRIVQFIHQSVNDCLLKDGFKRLDNSLGDSVAGKSHFEIYRSCIRYFFMEEIRTWDLSRPFVNPRTSTSLRIRAVFGANERRIQLENFKKKHPLFKYANLEWIYHAMEAEKAQISQADLKDFFNWPTITDVQRWREFKSVLTSRDTFKPDGCSLLHIAANYGLLSLITAIVTSKKDNEEPQVVLDINTVKDRVGCTALHYAARAGQEEAVELLLKYGANLGAKAMYGETPLVYTVSYYAFSYGDWNLTKSMLQLLLIRGAKIDDSQSTEDSVLPLIINSKHPDAKEMVELLIAHGADVKRTYVGPTTALHVAIQNENEPIVRLLLEKGAATNFYSYGGIKRALMVVKGHKGITRALKEYGALNRYLD